MGNASGKIHLCGTVAVIEELPQNKSSAVENTLDIHVIEEDDGTYRLKLEYDASRYSEKAMQQYAAAYDEMLSAMQADGRQLAEILP